MQLLCGDPVTGRIPVPVTGNAGIINTRSMDSPGQVKKRDTLRARPVRQKFAPFPVGSCTCFPLYREYCALAASERISF